MRGWLLDTNVVSELRRPKPDIAVAEFVTLNPAKCYSPPKSRLAKLGLELSSSKMRAAVLIFIYGLTERFGRCSPTASSPLPRM